MGVIRCSAPLLAVVVLVLVLVHGTVAADRHYLFTAPKASTAGELERMCLTLFNVPETGDLSVEISNHRDRRTLHTQLVSGVADGAEQTCFDVKMPDKSTHNDMLHLSVKFPREAKYSISGERRIEIRSAAGEPDSLFIQTDKYVYKPGQLVRFRIFSVDSDLRPITKPLPLIYIETPLGTRVAQWTDERGRSGLHQLQLQLSDEPTLGDWTIHVTEETGKVHTKTFQVKEYVLPKFEVAVKGPPFIPSDADQVTFKVCGTYTYGKPVAGNATVYIHPQRGYIWETGRRFQIIGGHPESKIVRHKVTGDADCAEFTLSAAELELDVEQSPRTGEQISYRVRAELNEAGTDTTVEAAKKFEVEYTKLKLSRDSSDSKYFKPGLPFIDTIKVQYPDGSPAPGELVRVCFSSGSSSGNVWENENEELCRRITSNEKGVVRFAVPAQSRNVHKLTIKATLPEVKRSAHPSIRVEDLQYSVEGWASNSGAFLQLSQMSGVKFSCGSTASIPLLFTTELGSQLELFYQVMSRGDLSPSTLVPVTFDQVTDLPTSVLEGVTVIGSRASDAKPTGLVTLSLSVTPAMSTGFKVLVYAVVDGEVVADSAQYEATPCLENSVSLRWSPDRVRPQQQTQLTVSAAPGSLCGIDVVDKSVHLLGTKNRITLSNFFDRLKNLNLGRNDGRSQKDDDAYCTAKHGNPRQHYVSKIHPEPDHPSPSIHSSHPSISLGSTRDLPPWRNRWTYSWTTVNVDSLAAFDDRSLVVLTDLVVETRKCVSRRSPDDNHIFFAPTISLDSGPVFLNTPVVQSAVAFAPSFVGAPMTTPGPTPPEPSPPEPSPVPETVRTYFPETWLFDLHTVGADGTVTVTEDAPDTITEWVAGAVCTSQAAGLGVSEPAALTSFQPFFVGYTLPYSVKRGETLVLKVSVRNYHQDDLPVKLTLVASDEYETLSPPVETMCVPAGASVVLPFKLRPSALGDVNITTVAEVYPDYPAVCGPETVLHFSDAVTRPILVEPEGFEREIVNSSFICSTDGDATPQAGAMEVEWQLNLPADLVPGSERAHVEVVGDLLGPSIDNLESLVRQPTGCGEQNMILFTPNIHVMKYLVAVGELTETLKDRLVEHMKSGYQRELTYRHNDKSYSAFGSSDDSGSMWLTAFVVKSFGDAKKFIFIDEDDLVGSVRWIESKQTADGCFPSVGRVLHKEMKGGVSAGGQQALTAFVTIALLRSGVTLGDNTLSGAFDCLHQNSSSADLYTLTLRTYARALAGHTDEARSGLTQLKERATRSEGMLYWENSEADPNKALSVEMGAYNILTMQLMREAGDTEQFSDALATVRWINSQRNSRGGFVSTQDTVLALEALATFSAALPGSSTSQLAITVVEPLGSNVFTVTPANRLLLQTREIGQLPALVSVRAEGEGCALVQSVLKYNVQEADPSSALSISVKSKPKPGQSKCLKHVVETCVSYQKAEESNMAVVEVEMVSGFIPNKGSLKALKENSELELKRWEVSKNKVVFYFDSLDSRQRCLEMVVQQDQEVEDVKPATATVYDYYQAEVTLSTTYGHDMECTTAAA